MFDRSHADFTSLTPLADEEEVWVSEATHSARVKIDEEGVEAAAYTVITADGAAALPEDEVDFVLDRPFFVSADRFGRRAALFVGVVNHVG